MSKKKKITKKQLDSMIEQVVKKKSYKAQFEQMGKDLESEEKQRAEYLEKFRIEHGFATARYMTPEEIQELLNKK